MAPGNSGSSVPPLSAPSPETLPSTETHLREVSLDWVRRALSEQLQDTSPAIEQRAEGLLAIAEHYEIPVEHLVQWIHLTAPGKEWTGVEFRKFAHLLATVRSERSEELPI